MVTLWLAAAAGALAGSGTALAEVPWYADLAQAKAASQVSRRPVLILFVATWSEASVAHDRTFLGTEESVALLTACFEPVRIDIDADKVAAATTAVLAESPPDLTDEEQLERYTNIMLMLGTAKGILLAEGALHKAEFCASATKEKADTQVANFWK